MRFTDADVHFMTGMIGHHAQALVMSDLAPSHGASPAVQTLAARIINAQKDEIALMGQWLRDRGQTVPEVHISGVTLPNRVLMGSMHTNLEETRDWNRVATFYARRAQGGVGLMVTGGIAPNPEGGVFAGASGLYSAEDIAHHRIVTDRVHGAGGRWLRSSGSLSPAAPL
jgi:hypothetical protein